VEALLKILFLLLVPLLRWKSRPSLVRRALERKRYTKASQPHGEIVRVGVVQLRGCFVRTTREYADLMYRLVYRAVENGAQLVIFPEDTGTYLFGGFIPGLDRFVGGNGGQTSEERIVEGTAPMLFLLRLISVVSERVYPLTFSLLAQHFGVYIIAGSGVAMGPDGGVRKVGYFFGPRGETIGEQPKTHLFTVEALWGLGRGDDIFVFRTPVGDISYPICMDHTFFEPIRIAWLKGAEIIVDPAANAERYSFWAQARGVWGRVQESPAYGIACFLVGELLGVPFEGRSGVYAPLEMTEKGDGVVAQARTVDDEEILITDLDLAALRRFRREHGPDFNLSLYQKYLPAAYADYSANEIEGRRSVI